MSNAVVGASVMCSGMKLVSQAGRFGKTLAFEGLVMNLLTEPYRVQTARWPKAVVTSWPSSTTIRSLSTRRTDSLSVTLQPNTATLAVHSV